ncbi:MAG: hypothetical protein AAF357_15050, partial [Verrucomicrobiota bacterium]
KLGLAEDLRRVPEEKIVLAELRETHRLAEAQLVKTKHWNISCPDYKAAMRTLSEMSDKLGEGYSEIEQAVSDRVDLSREKIKYWREQVADTVEQLSVMDRLQPAMA